jgi:ribosomal protein L10
MPKSKISKIVTLTKKKKTITKESKSKKIDEIKKCMEDYTDLYVIRLINYKSTPYKKFLIDWRDNSKIFFCKRYLVGVALGKTEEDEVEKGLHNVYTDMIHYSILFFTNESKTAVENYFNNFVASHFAKPGIPFFLLFRLCCYKRFFNPRRSY